MQPIFFFVKNGAWTHSLVILRSLGGIFCIDRSLGGGGGLRGGVTGGLEGAGFCICARYEMEDEA
jgi:hypothetical protein